MSAELDNLNIIQTLNSPSLDYSNKGLLIKDIRVLSRSFSYVNFNLALEKPI